MSIPSAALAAAQPRAESFKAAAYQIVPSLPKALEAPLGVFLNTKPGLSRNLQEELNGEHGSYKTWEAVCVKLSEQPFLTGKITLDWIKRIKRGRDHITAAKDFVDKVSYISGCSIGLFVKALVETDSCFLKISNAICAAVPIASNWDPRQHKFVLLGPAQISTRLSLDNHLTEFLQNELELYYEIVKAVAEQKIPEKSWRGVVHQLSTQDAFKGKFKPNVNTWCAEIESPYRLPFEKSEAIFSCILGMKGATVRALVKALMTIDPSYERLCEKICDKAGASDFIDSLNELPADVEKSEGAPLPSQTALAPLLTALATEKQRNTILQEDKEALRQKRDAPELDSTNCKICKTRKIDVILKPCKHLNMCRVCVQVQKMCPVCHQPIDRSEIVYVG